MNLPALYLSLYQCSHTIELNVCVCVCVRKLRFFTEFGGRD